MRITQLDKRGEIVTLSGTGELTGWAIVSETGGQQFDFPEGFTMSGEVVQVISGRAQFGNTATQLWWTRASVWNNDDPDPALLLCRGNVIQRFGS